jgi:hypothetical protein
MQVLKIVQRVAAFLAAGDPLEHPQVEPGAPTMVLLLDSELAKVCSSTVVARTRDLAEIRLMRHKPISCHKEKKQVPRFEFVVVNLQFPVFAICGPLHSSATPRRTRSLKRRVPIVLLSLSPIRYPHYHPVAKKLADNGTQYDRDDNVPVVVHSEQHDYVRKTQRHSMDNRPN